MIAMAMAVVTAAVVVVGLATPSTLFKQAYTPKPNNGKGRAYPPHGTEELTSDLARARARTRPGARARARPRVRVR